MRAIDVKLFIPESIEIVPVVDSTVFSKTPESYEIAAITIQFKGLIGPMEYITGEMWLSDSEVSTIKRTIDASLKRRRNSLSKGVTDEVGIFNIRYMVG
jgi:hypothetical protein